MTFTKPVSVEVCDNLPVNMSVGDVCIVGNTAYICTGDDFEILCDLPFMSEEGQTSDKQRSVTRYCLVRTLRI